MLPAAEPRGINCKFQVCHPGQLRPRSEARRMHPASTRVASAYTKSTRGGLRAGIQNPTLTGSRIFFTALKNSGTTQLPTPEQSSEELCRFNRFLRAQRAQ